MDIQLKKRLLTEQRNEITGHLIYTRVARRTKNDNNRHVLEHIAADEKRHYEYLKSLTGRDVQPHGGRVLLFTVMCAILGLSFTLKLLERQEQSGQKSYGELLPSQDGLASLLEEEDKHEIELIGMLDEDRLKYISSIVLGLNDALVELTGAPDRVKGRFRRYFHLQQNHGGGLKQRIVFLQIGNAAVFVRPRNHNDIVLSPVVDADNGGAGRFTRGYLQMGNVNPRLFQMPDLSLPESVVPHASEKGNAAFQLCGRARLVGPLSARRESQSPADHGFPHPRQGGQTNGDIRVDAADDQYLAAHLFSFLIN